MSRKIQVRDVPESVYQTLKARAALAGMSLSEFLLAEIRRVAGKSTIAKLRERVRRRKPVTAALSAAQAVRRERDAR